LFKGNDLFFTVDEWNDHNLSSFTRIGTRFGSIAKNNKMQLHSYAAQYFADHIKENIYHIRDKQELKNYLGGGIIRTKSFPGIMKIIKYNDMILGTSVPVHNGLKSQFPKSKRMQEIII
jgi:NOL1/NOP2/fmu family ribosome biogenesis protein